MIANNKGGSTGTAFACAFMVPLLEAATMEIKMMRGRIARGLLANLK
jgi:hypothetical protein